MGNPSHSHWSYDDLCRYALLLSHPWFSQGDKPIDPLDRWPIVWFQAPSAESCKSLSHWAPFLLCSLSAPVNKVSASCRLCFWGRCQKQWFESVGSQDELWELLQRKRYRPSKWFVFSIFCQNSSQYDELSSIRDWKRASELLARNPKSREGQKGRRRVSCWVSFEQPLFK